MKTKVMKAPRSLLILSVMWLCVGAFLLLTTSAHAQEKALEVATNATGQVELVPSLDSPIYVEFERSAALTQRIGAVLTDAGFKLAESKERATVTIAFSGDLVLLGGPVFYKGAKLSIGEVTERTLASVKNGQGNEVQTAVANGTTVALNAAAYVSTASPFLRGMQMSRMVDAIGDQLGLKASFNTALTGDPRGWCLSRCADWKKTNQTAYLTVKVNDGKQSQVIRVKASAFEETLAPDQVVMAALEASLKQISIKEAAVALNAQR